MTRPTTRTAEPTVEARFSVSKSQQGRRAAHQRDYAPKRLPSLSHIEAARATHRRAFWFSSSGGLPSKAEAGGRPSVGTARGGPVFGQLPNGRLARARWHLNAQLHGSLRAARTPAHRRYLAESLAFEPKGLADLHYDFGRVGSVVAIVWRQDAVTVSVVNFRIWTPIGCAVFFFLMFGFTAEARTC
ncbi:hypothetical protein LXA43DRAFT_1083029 [Ganoderma leucocontextum]|nr:hypothetical protein LXA43DRAFT_1083029 [Ganoderma leucocontextum]